MKLNAYLIATILIFFCTPVFAQEIIPEATVNTLPGAKCYWAYSVYRVGTAHDSLHYYSIHVSLVQQVDDYSKGPLKIHGARIYCEFTDNHRKRKVRCIPIDDYLIADFSIHTNAIIPVMITANYNKQFHQMPLKLNTGIYPGENDPDEE